MKNSKILVIGSNSFSGSNFVNHALRKGYETWGVSRSKEPNKVFLPYKWKDAENSGFSYSKLFKFSQIDINNNLDDLFKIIKTYQPDIVVNFAAQGMVAESWQNPTHWYKTNLLSQVGLHDYLRKQKFIKKYVHVTTPEVYGSTDNGWIKENLNFSPSTPYAVSRAACDLHLNSFFNSYKFPVVFTRAANVFGPGQQLYRIIPRAILSAKLSKPMQLHGGGKSERSFIHIEDVVKATLKLALDAEAGTTWHISTNNSISIYDLVKKIFENLSGDFNGLVNISEERLGKDQSYLLDSNNLRKTHAWSDKISLDLGLKQTINWVEENISTLKNLPWNYTHKL